MDMVGWGAKDISLTGWEVLLNSDDARYSGRSGGPGNSTMLWRSGGVGGDVSPATLGNVQLK